MKVTPKEALAGLVIAVLAGAGIWAEVAGDSSVAVVALLILMSGVAALQLVVLRRVALREKRLSRIEEKLDVLSRRVITEAEASSREILGRIDALAAETRRTD